MKTKIMLVLGLAILACFIAFAFGCTNKEPVVDDSGTTQEGIAGIVDANNRFAFDMFSQITSEKGNIFFSPYSISSALAMTYEGARGKTAEEIKAVFHFPGSTSMRSDFAGIYNEINKPNKKYELDTANALWVQKDFTLLPEYLNTVQQFYAGKATNLDFVKETEQSRVTINNWVEERTRGKIKELLSQGIIGSDTRLVLTNAIYFKGVWVKEFDSKNTFSRDFRISTNNVVRVPTMSMTGEDAEFNYAETSKMQVLELPYSGQEISMLILLPTSDDTASLEKEFTAQKLNALKQELKMQRVDIYIPKFKLETKYRLNDQLTQLGMPTAFSGMADFSGMTGGRDLYISNVIHKAFVEVNEQGTEAAAATAVEMRVTSVGPGEDIKEFRADHPFIFIIQQKATGNILFMGRVNDPS